MNKQITLFKNKINLFSVKKRQYNDKITLTALAAKI